MAVLATRKRKSRLGGSNIPTYIILAICSLGVSIPLFWMVVTAFKTQSESTFIPPTLWPKEWTIDGFKMVFTSYPMPIWFWNTLKITVVSTVGGVILSALGGYGSSRYRFPGKQFFLAFLLITQMFPSVMMLIPYYNLLRILGLLNTHEGLMLLYTAHTIPFCTWMMKGYFDTIPLELDEAARIDGCSTLGIFWKVVLPLALPGLAATVIYAFLGGWNEYQLAMVTMKPENMKTLTVGVAQMNTEYRIAWNEIMAASMVAQMPVLLMYLFFQKYFISSLTAGAVKQ